MGLLLLDERGHKIGHQLPQVITAIYCAVDTVITGSEYAVAELTAGCWLKILCLTYEVDKSVSPATPSSDESLEAFERGWREINIQWSRFGLVPDLRGKDVLDIGSGYGTLCVSAAMAGAKSVVGMDIHKESVDAAAAHVRRHYQSLPVCFTTEMPDRQFDVILSKDTFEHAMDVPKMLADVREHLKPGGLAYIGFAPLYYSPYGDHDYRERFLPFGKFFALIPWAHLVLWRWMVRGYNAETGLDARTMRDMYLNCVRFSEFLRDFKASGLEIVSLKTNVSTNPLAKLCSVLRRIKRLENFCTNSIYCVLRKS